MWDVGMVLCSRGHGHGHGYGYGHLARITDPAVTCQSKWLGRRRAGLWNSYEKERKNRCYPGGWGAGLIVIIVQRWKPWDGSASAADSEMSKLLWFFNGSPYRFGQRAILIEFLFIYEWRQTIYNVSTIRTYKHITALCKSGLLFINYFLSFLHLVYLSDFWLLTPVLPCRQIWYLCVVYLPRYSMGKHSKNLYIYQEAGVHQKEFTINSRICPRTVQYLCAKVVLEVLDKLNQLLAVGSHYSGDLESLPIARRRCDYAH